MSTEADVIVDSSTASLTETNRAGLPARPRSLGEMKRAGSYCSLYVSDARPASRSRDSRLGAAASSCHPNERADFLGLLFPSGISRG